MTNPRDELRSAKHDAHSPERPMTDPARPYETLDELERARRDLAPAIHTIGCGRVIGNRCTCERTIADILIDRLIATARLALAPSKVLEGESAASGEPRSDSDAAERLAEALDLCRVEACHHDVAADEAEGAGRPHAGYADYHRGSARTYRWMGEQLRGRGVSVGSAAAPAQEIISGSERQNAVSDEEVARIPVSGVLHAVPGILFVDVDEYAVRWRAKGEGTLWFQRDQISDEEPAVVLRRADFDRLRAASRRSSPVSAAPTTRHGKDCDCGVNLDGGGDL